LLIDSKNVGIAPLRRGFLRKSSSKRYSFLYDMDYWKWYKVIPHLGSTNTESEIKTNL